MRASAGPVRWPCCAFVLLLAACTGGPPAFDDSSQNAGELRQGEVTSALPQIGQMLGTHTDCTGALVGLNWVLTAAHCVDYGARDLWVWSGEPWGRFIIQPEDLSARRTVPIDAYTSFGTAAGADDVALLHLSESVIGLEPLRLRPDQPQDGEVVQIYGYGAYDCTGADTHGPWDGQKRVYAFTWGQEPRATCSGDSGGPVLTDSGIPLVSSGVTYDWGSGQEFTLFGSVWPHYDELQAIIDSWQ